MDTRTLLSAALLSFAVAGCNRADNEDPATVAATRNALMQVDTDFSKASEAHGVPAAFLMYCADNATLLPGGAEPVTGRDSIRALLAGSGEGVLTWKPVDAAGSGDLGYTWGTYVAKERNAAGRDTVRYGKYLTVWRKQADGAWRFILDIGNPSPAPAAQ